MARHHDDQEHPVLTDKENAAQRGESPPGAFGHTDLPSGDLDPGWAPTDDVRDAAQGTQQGDRGRA